MMLSHIGIVMKFVVVVMLFCVLVGGEEVRCIGREREALVSFKNGLIDEFGILSSWRGEECCNWFGVECSNTTGNVIGLGLDNDYYYYHYHGSLRGKITPSLLDLHHLIYLDLSFNDFGGLPIPQFIGSMKQLQYLNLQYSGFSGIVPPQLGNLTNLQFLDLSDNSLSSTNLNWLSSLSLLLYLDFSHSFLLNHTSSLQQILTLPSLEYLYLKSCNIADDNLSAGLTLNSSSTSLSFLDLLGNLLTSFAFNLLSNFSSSLVGIRLDDNKLSGQIPDVFERYIHLEFLDASYNMLEGEIPKSLGNLTHLRVLALYYNELRGEVDELVGNLNLSSKGILRSLEVLDLANNQLSGSVPDLRPFSALTELYLGSNKFTGTMPVSVGQLTKLRILEVSHNNLEGNVTESHFIKLHNLMDLDLSYSSLNLNIAPDWSPPFQLYAIMLANCSVGPSFPKWIQTQTNLALLDISSSGLKGEIPMWLWNFSHSLEYLFLSHNQITGTLPDLSSIPLMGIDLSDNEFSGLIPLFHPFTKLFQLSQNMLSGSISSICKIRHDGLGFLTLSSNQLSGELPNCWEKMPNLLVLQLDNNTFSNNMPHSLGSLRNLQTLQLHNNRLSGKLPSTLRFCQHLVIIDIGGNELTGEIPNWIGEIHSLQILSLGSNRLNGSIPHGMCNLTFIRILDIHKNNLSGRIHDCFNNFTILAPIQSTYPRMTAGYMLELKYDPLLPHMFKKIYSEYSLVGWKRQESEYAKSLPGLGLIDLSSNRLTGNIPQSLSTLRGLRSLNLSRNILTGNIIPHIGQMEMLESLDISNNQLSGEIPTSLAKLHFLSVLDLSDNNLSGEIPSSTQLQSFDASSYAGNNGLCGKPLTLCPKDIQRPPTTTIARGEKGDVFSRVSFMQGLGISIAFGFIFGFWGLIGSFILKKPWRYAFFKSMDGAGEWLCLRYEMNMKRMRSDKSKSTGTQKKQIECGRVNRGVRQS